MHPQPLSKSSLNYNDYGQPTTTPSPNQGSKQYHLINSRSPQKYINTMFSKRYTSTISDNKQNSYIQNQRSRFLQQNYSINQGNQQLFNQNMIFLLSEEEHNIIYFKQKIDNQRNKIQRLFQNMKQKLIHIVQDLKISFQAQLDKSYKNFIAKYIQFKSLMQQLKDIRKNLSQQSFLNKSSSSQYISQSNPTKNISLSNRDLLNQIEKDAKMFQNHKLYTKITQMQRQIIIPAKKVTQDLIAMAGTHKQYYNQDATRNLMQGIVSIFQNQVNHIYDNIIDNYVMSTDKIIQIHTQAKQQHTMILNGLLNQEKSEYQSQNQQTVNRKNFKSLDPKDLVQSNATYVSKNIVKKQPDTSYQYGLSSPRGNVIKQPKRQVRPASHSIDNQVMHVKKDKQRQQGRKYSQYQQGSPSQLQVVTSKNQNRNYQMAGTFKINDYSIGLSQQTLSHSWIQQIKLIQKSRIIATQHKDSILCCSFVNRGRQIVTAGKDMIIRVYDIQTNRLIKELKGHQANVCSMMVTQGLLFTGGDHGCGQLIIWDLSTWAITTKFQGHSAALTAIVDFDDNQHVCTASYDKKILIFNYQTLNLSFEIKAHTAAIACMSLTSDGNKLISTGLDNTISIWKLIKNNGKLIGIEIEKTFSSNGLVCSLRTSKIRPDIFAIGTKQGRIYIISLKSGQILKKLQISSSSIIQLVLFQRENKPQWPLILSCSSKDKTMILTKSQNGLNTFVNVKGKVNVEYGCGIGPKIVLAQGFMAVLSQAKDVREVVVYQLKLM